jgi:hypothetical protein
MKFHLVLLCFLNLGFRTHLAAQQFPDVSLENLSGELTEFPAAVEGTYTLVGIGSSKRAEEELRTWQEPVYNKFIAKTGFMDDLYEVEVVFIPVFTGAMKATKNKVIKTLREENHPLVGDHLWIYSGDWKVFESLGLEDKGTPLFLLLDPQGRAVWKKEGAFRQEYFTEIEEILTQ